jgi:translation initiation factor 2 subunit 1
LKRERFPTIGDLTIATVQKIFSYGAYVSLDEYDSRQGFVPISEVSSGWIKNIRDFLRESQKVVLKVIRVDEKRGLIDLSLRRVSVPEKRDKLLEWKRDRMALAILKSVVKALKFDDEVLEKLRVKLEGNFGGVYEGIEAGLSKGPSILVEAGLSKREADALISIAASKMKRPKAKLRGILSLRCFKGNGADIIRRILSNVTGAVGKDVNVSVFTLGAPRYILEVESSNLKLASTVLSELSDKVLKEIEKEGGVGSFEEEK